MTAPRPSWAARTLLALLPAPLKRFIAIATFSAYQAVSEARRQPRPLNTATMRGSADTLLTPALPDLIAQSRHLARNHPAARAAIDGRSANLIGRGIGIEPDTGDSTLDELLSDGFDRWAESAMADGGSLWVAQLMAASEHVEAGGFLWRWVLDGERPTQGLLADCLLAYDLAWLAQDPVAPVASGNTFAAGIESDAWGRPRFFHLRHPDAVHMAGTVQDERVPAADMIHGFLPRRPGQRRGEPALAPAVLMLWNGQTLIEAELKSAVAGAAGPAVLIKTRSAAADISTQIGQPQTTEAQALTGSAASLPGVSLGLPSGGVAALFPDEDIVTVANNRPNQDILPFLKGIWGTVAASLHVGRRWLDRDYSDANYTALRADQFDSRRLLEPEQHALGRFLALAPYRRMAPLIAAQAGRPLSRQPIQRERALRAVLQPDGWQYVDPEKDVRADVSAIAAGLDSFTAACARRGSSFRDVLRQRVKDQQAIVASGITVDLGGAAPTPTTPSSPSDHNADPTPTAASGSGANGADQ